MFELQGDEWPSRDESHVAAIAAGVAFLMSQRRAGFWHDFTLAPGPSDEWVTGYVGSRLHPIVGSSSELKESWEALRARAKWRGCGWSYNGFVPQDADSTSWALRLAAALGIECDEVTTARNSLDAFRHDDGMFGTYGPTEAIRAFIGATEDRSFAGWTSPHACVTGAAAGLAGMVSDSVLEGCQDPDGHWHSYWWESDAFATALVVEALRDEPTRARGGAWALAQLTEPESHGPFTLAHLVHAACVSGLATDARVAAAAHHLARTALDDGSWRGDARMRVPDPGDEDPDAPREWIEGGRIEGAVVHDQRRIFTTATVVHALSVYGAGRS